MTIPPYRLVPYLSGGAKDYAVRQIMKDPQSMLEAAREYGCPAWLLALLAQSGETTVLLEVASHENADEETLQKLATSKSKKIAEMAQRTLQEHKGREGKKTPEGSENATALTRAADDVRMVSDGDVKGLQKSLAAFTHELVVAIEAEDPSWERIFDQLENYIETTALLEALAKETCQAAEYKKLIAELYEEVVASLNDTVGYALEDSELDMGEIVKLREITDLLAKTGNLPSGKKVKAIAKLAGNQTPLQDLYATLRSPDVKSAGDLARLLAYIHPEADLGLIAATQTGWKKAGGIPKEALPYGKDYGTKTHTEMLLTQFPPNATFALLGDKTVNWKKLVEPDLLARAVGRAIEEGEYLPDLEGLTDYMTLPVALELVKTEDWDLYSWLVNEFQKGGNLAVAASYNNDLCEEEELEEVWSVVPVEQVGDMSVSSLIRAIDLDWIGEKGEKNVERALKILGESLGEDERSLIATEGLSGTFPGSVKELGHLSKEAIMIEEETKTPRKGAPRDVGAKPTAGRKPQL